MSLRDAGCLPTRAGDGWSARCPAHEDQSPSLSISSGKDGRALIACHAGCEFEQVVSSLGLQKRDLFVSGGGTGSEAIKVRPKKRKPQLHSTREAATNAARRYAKSLDGPSNCWEYQDSDGQLWTVVLRFDVRGGKEIRQVTPTTGGWVVGLNGSSGNRPLYRLPEIAGADRVFIAEGEKCADAIASLGLVATTTIGGSKSPMKSDLAPLENKAVSIFIDRDDPGRKYGRVLADALAGLGCEVRVVEPPVADGDDVHDLIAMHREAGSTDDEIRSEILRLADEAPIYEVSETGEPDFATDKNGRPHPTQANLRIAINRLGVTLTHDEFADRSMITGLDGFGPALDDKAVNRLWLTIDERFQLGFGKDKFWAMVIDEALRNRRHPVREYLDGLQWDERPRIDRWLVEFLGAEDSDYVRAVGRLVLVAAVRRVRSPGCKFDEMMVLEGSQGGGKSTALSVLAVCEDWFSDDLPLNADTKRLIEVLSGRWIVEAGELRGMRKGEVEALKSTLSRTHDRARMAYGRAVSELPRQSVIVGTTNASQYLRDMTGHRRFWPVRTGRIDLAGLQRDRDQIWAEAALAEASNESIRLDPSLYAAAGAEQEERERPNPFVEPLSEALEEVSGHLSTEHVWRLVGLPEIGRRTQQQNDDLGDAMRRLGFDRTKRRIDGRPRWCYVRGDGPLMTVEDVDSGQPIVMPTQQREVF